MPLVSSSILTLSVKEAPPGDKGRGIGRVDRGLMKLYGWEVGDLIEIASKEKKRPRLGIRVIHSRPIDGGLPIIRLDEIIRNNLKIDLDMKVLLKPIPLVPAKQITLAPLSKRTRLLVVPNTLKRLLQNRAFRTGERLEIYGGIRHIPAHQTASDKPLPIVKRSIPIVVFSTLPASIVVVDCCTQLRIIELFRYST